MTPPLDPLLSPQAQAALIAGLFLAAGWWVVAVQTSMRDRRQRRARVDDMQRALLAEVRAHVVSLERQLQAGMLDDLLERIEDGDAALILPHGGNDRIFRAVLADIHLLPGPVIDPVVIYYRLIAVMDSMADSIRTTAQTKPGQATDMMLDYILLNEESLDAGLDVLEILTASLQGGEAEIQALLHRQSEETGKTIQQNLPQELAQMRAGLNKRSSDRSGL